MKRQHYCGQFRYRPDRPTTLPATPNLYSPRRRYCAAHECRDRQRDRNILLSKPLSGGSLKVVVARAPRDLRSYPLATISSFAILSSLMAFSPLVLPSRPARFKLVAVSLRKWGKREKWGNTLSPLSPISPFPPFPPGMAYARARERFGHYSHHRFSPSLSPFPPSRLPFPPAPVCARA